GIHGSFHTTTHTCDAASGSPCRTRRAAGGSPLSPSREIRRRRRPAGGDPGPVPGLRHRPHVRRQRRHRPDLHVRLLGVDLRQHPAVLHLHRLHHLAAVLGGRHDHFAAYRGECLQITLVSPSSHKEFPMNTVPPPYAPQQSGFNGPIPTHLAWSIVVTVL